MVGRNKELEQEVLDWIAAVLEEPLPPGAFEDVLKDGVILCRLMNKLEPGSVNKIQTSGGSFKLMENIERFQKAAKKYGVPHEEIFQTADLFERRNIPQVVISLYSLGRITQKHPEYKGPSLGPKMAEADKKVWDEDQQRALREGQIGLQMGQNKGATQAGQGAFGNSRHM
ncbi:muscle-specific protein 20 [Hyalella azteca]|uniref:Muscle-specific protein 20 n=1 Tax=Hyalella azteca TaxID=294128 RepID=A0A8B7NSS8_HYAAZ|nr:muscle-specific protein 20 [Hyalella azteca]